MNLLGTVKHNVLLAMVSPHLKANTATAKKGSNKVSVTVVLILDCQTFPACCINRHFRCHLHCYNTSTWRLYDLHFFDSESVLWLIWALSMSRRRLYTGEHKYSAVCSHFTERAANCKSTVIAAQASLEQFS